MNVRFKKFLNNLNILVITVLGLQRVNEPNMHLLTVTGQYYKIDFDLLDKFNVN